MYASLLHFFWMKCLARIECIYLNTTKKDAEENKRCRDEPFSSLFYYCFVFTCMDDKFKMCYSIWPNDLLFMLSFVDPIVPETRPAPGGYRYRYKNRPVRLCEYGYALEFRVLCRGRVFTLPAPYPICCHPYSLLQPWLNRVGNRNMKGFL